MPPRPRRDTSAALCDCSSCAIRRISLNSLASFNVLAGSCFSAHAYRGCIRPRGNPTMTEKLDGDASFKYRSRCYLQAKWRRSSAATHGWTAVVRMWPREVVSSTKRSSTVRADCLAVAAAITRRRKRDPFLRPPWLKLRLQNHSLPIQKDRTEAYCSHPRVSRHLRAGEVESSRSTSGLAEAGSGCVPVTISLAPISLP